MLCKHTAGQNAKHAAVRKALTARMIVDGEVYENAVLHFKFPVDPTGTIFGCSSLCACLLTLPHRSFPRQALTGKSIARSPLRPPSLIS
jgi:hypothetical protein